MNRRRRTIAVVTGTRAEFGLLRPVMAAIDAHRSLTLRVIVTGLHLRRRTWRDITDAGFDIDAELRMQQAGQVGRAADIEAVSRGVRGFGRARAGARRDGRAGRSDRAAGRGDRGERGRLATGARSRRRPRRGRGR
jgi:hypothetical protein